MRLFLDYFLSSTNYFFSNFGEPLFRLVLAVLTGSIIGYQRQSVNKPAGVKTHVLVCLGSALVMVTSEYIFEKYQGIANLDPARLGAQVVSGIGFLCAGTILREGSSVRGLTTAAAIWSVACLGLTIGAGCYAPAIIAAILIYLVLLVSDKLIIKAAVKTHETSKLIVVCNTNLDIIEKVENILDSHNVETLSIKINHLSKNEFSEISIITKFIEKKIIQKIINEIYEIPDIIKVM